MSRKIKRSDCNGCYNEDYHHGLGGAKKCWSFDDATLSMGRLLSIHTMPEKYSGRYKLIPDCYTKKQYFVERIKNEEG